MRIPVKLHIRRAPGGSLETGNAGVRPVVMAHKIIADYLRANGWLK